MPISLGFWEWGCPKRGDAHVTVTPTCVPQMSLGSLLGTRWSDIGHFSPASVTVPENFAKVSSTQSPLVSLVANSDLFFFSSYRCQCKRRIRTKDRKDHPYEQETAVDSTTCPIHHREILMRQN